MQPRISIITLCTDDMHRAYKFYKDGLGFPTPQKIDEPIYFFNTGGSRLAIYPKEKMAEEFKDGRSTEKGAFPGFTLAHNTKSKDEVDEILTTAQKAGGKIIKPAEDVFWGGYSGYFEDPDGFLWEVAFAGDCFKFDEHDNLIIE
jgi:hypothetical protein